MNIQALSICPSFIGCGGKQKGKWEKMGEKRGVRGGEREETEVETGEETEEEKGEEKGKRGKVHFANHEVSCRRLDLIKHLNDLLGSSRWTWSDPCTLG